MIKKIIIFLLIIAFIVVATINKFHSANQPIACTMDAKVCPDGSAVGRVAPNCEFAPCPQINSQISESEAREIA